MLLPLAVAAMLLFPAAASAQEAHVSGITNFTGSGGTGTLSASGEPTITCTALAVSGSFDSGSTTTGKFTLDFTGCSAEFFGIKANCNTSGAASGTIASSGTFHVITVNNKPGALATTVTTTVICAGFSNTTVAGNFIATVTSPACGSSSNSLGVVAKSSGSTQEDMEYTGVKYDLTAQTGSGSKITAGISTGTVTLKASTAGTLECT
jgi:hypothetical protein